MSMKCFSFFLIGCNKNRQVDTAAKPHSSTGGRRVDTLPVSASVSGCVGLFASFHPICCRFGWLADMQAVLADGPMMVWHARATWQCLQTSTQYKAHSFAFLKRATYGLFTMPTGQCRVCGTYYPPANISGTARCARYSFAILTSQPTPLMDKRRSSQCTISRQARLWRGPVMELYGMQPLGQSCLLCSW